MFINSVLIFIIMLFTNPCDAKDYSLKCGNSRVNFSENYRLISDVQLNWGSVNSCIFENGMLNPSKIKFIYQYVPIYINKKLTKNEETLISEFFAQERNIYNAELYQKTFGNEALWCFNELAEQDNKIDVRCFYFKNKSKREIRLFGVNKNNSDKLTLIGSIDLD